MVICWVLFRQGVTSGAVVVATAAIILMAVSSSHPRKVECQIHDDGVVVNGRVYRFDQCKSFWIAGGDIIRVKILLSGTLGGEITMPLGETSIEEVRNLLKSHLPEEAEKGEDLWDLVNKYLHF